MQTLQFSSATRYNWTIVFTWLNLTWKKVLGNVLMISNASCGSGDLLTCKDFWRNSVLLAQIGIFMYFTETSVQSYK